jgi:GNAT superfamily N-acetyltransferase
VDVEFCTSVDRVDRDWLWHELTEHAYWAKYRTRDMFEKQLDAAWRVVGAYDTGDGRMVGFARAFSDGAALAYLADVYVHRHERGRGIGAGILRAMIDDGKSVRFRLATETPRAALARHPSRWRAEPRIRRTPPPGFIRMLARYPTSEHQQGRKPTMGAGDKISNKIDDIGGKAKEALHS